MRLRHMMTAAALLAALGAVAGCDDDDDDDDGDVEIDAGLDAGRIDERDAGPVVPARTVRQVVVDDDRFDTLEAALRRADLLDELSTGEVTLFAPTDDAFDEAGIDLADIEAMGEDELRQLLRYHLITDEELRADELRTAPLLTAADLTLFVGTDGEVVLNRGREFEGGANVVAEVDADNGVIHVIDRVLVPPDVVQLAANAGLESLTTALTTAQLDDELEGEGPFTVFAPSDAAFEAFGTLPQGAELEQLLLFHVVDQRLTTVEIDDLEVPFVPTLAQNAFGNPLVLAFDPSDELIVDGTVVTQTNLKATNGVVFIVDDVLVPPNAVQMIDFARLTGLQNALARSADFEGEPLTEVLAGEGPFTILAPTDEAFAEIDDTLAGFTPEQVRDLLLFHVIDAPTPVLRNQLPATVGAELDTLLGVPATVTSIDPFAIDDANVVITDVNVTNGVIHVIDAVMIPDALE